MMQRGRCRSARFGLCGAVLALLAAGCSPGPRAPLLSPIETAHGYGYSDRSLGEARFSVSYTGPSRLASASPSQRDADTQAAQSQAFDFALWHAAQIAEANGYPGFRISDKRTDVDTDAEPGYDDRSCSPFGGTLDAFGIYHGAPVGYGHPGCFPDTPYARIQAHASIEIQLVRAVEQGDYSARDVMAELERTYPGADRLPKAD